jgi:hypothetical protein
VEDSDDDDSICPSDEVDFQVGSLQGHHFSRTTKSISLYFAQRDLDEGLSYEGEIAKGHSRISGSDVSSATASVDPNFPIYRHYRHTTSDSTAYDVPLSKSMSLAITPGDVDEELAADGLDEEMVYADEMDDSLIVVGNDATPSTAIIQLSKTRHAVSKSTIQAVLPFKWIFPAVVQDHSDEEMVYGGQVV